MIDGVFVQVDDVDAHHTHAVASGATVIRAPEEPGVGFRIYTVEDLEGHRWMFGQRVSDDLVRLKIVSSELEAEMLRGLLEEEGIHSMYRPTDVAAASFDGWSPGGAREVLVAAATWNGRVSSRRK